jgi:hypothetical protein
MSLTKTFTGVFFRLTKRKNTAYNQLTNGLYEISIIYSELNRRGRKKFTLIKWVLVPRSQKYFSRVNLKGKKKRKIKTRPKKNFFSRLISHFFPPKNSQNYLFGLCIVCE